MAYVKRYAGGFVDKPTLTTPIDSAFLNAVEAALLALYDAAPGGANMVPVWTPGGTHYVPQLLTNASIDPAAAIVKSKIDLTGANGVVNADIAGAAAIAYSKLALATSIARTDMAAGFKFTVGTLAAGPPGAPTTNDIWIATDVDANGTVWTFRYNSAEATNKWEFVGGSDIYVAVETEETTASAAYADLATVGPSFTFARAGDYDISFGCEDYNDTATNPVQVVAVKRGAAATVDADGLASVLATANVTTAVVARSLKISPAAADVYKLQYKTTAATAHFRKRWLRIQPIRII